MLAKMSRKKATLAIVIIGMIAAVGTVIACPNFAVSSQASQSSQQATTRQLLQTKDFALNDDGWQNLEQFLQTSNTAFIAHNVTAQSKGWAFQRIDNETIKQYALELNLTIELGPEKGRLIPIVNVTGSLSVHSTSFNAVYMIESGRGIIDTNKHLALISAQGVDAQNNPVTLKGEVNYFWWGGRLFAFRGKALLYTNENPMLLLLRYGIAKVQ